MLICSLESLREEMVKTVLLLCLAIVFELTNLPMTCCTIKYNHISLAANGMNRVRKRDNFPNRQRG